MDIALAKRRENIAEYILYLWQIEDLLRALQFSPEAIYSQLIAPRGIEEGQRHNYLLWYMDIAKQVYRPDIYRQAAEELIAEGKLKVSDFPDFASETGFKAPDNHFIDGVTYDGHKPNDYLKQFPIGLKGDQQP